MPTTPLPPSPRGPENLRALRSSAPTCGYAALADSVYRTCRCLEASLWPRQSHACTKHRTHIHIASELPNPKPTTSKTPSKVAPYFKFEIVRQNNKLGMKPRLPAKQAHTPSPHRLTPQSSGGRLRASEKKKNTDDRVRGIRWSDHQERDGTGLHRGRPSRRPDRTTRGDL